MNIRLHPEHGVNPTILQYQCPTHGHLFESGELALLGFNKNKKADMYSVAGLQFCEECQTNLNRGFVVLVGFDEEKTKDRQNPYRTGEIIYLRKNVADELFNAEIKTMAFVESKVIKTLINRAKEAQDE